jgi:hypothetical protein
VPFIVQKLAGKQSLIDIVVGKVLRIGRGTNSDLRFDDVAVALEHAVIERAGAGYRLLDRGSVTGTYLNGKPVREAKLAHDDLINIGGYQIRVQITDPEGPPFLSVRASAAVDPPPEATMRISPKDLAAMVRAATAAAGETPAEIGATAGSALPASAVSARHPAHPGPGEAAPEPPAGHPAHPGPGTAAAPAAELGTMRMSPEAVAAALKAAAAAAEIAAWEAAASKAAAAAGEAAGETTAGELTAQATAPPAPPAPLTPGSKEGGVVVGGPADEAAAREFAAWEAVAHGEIAAGDAARVPAPDAAAPAFGAPPAPPPSAPPATPPPAPPPSASSAPPPSATPPPAQRPPAQRPPSPPAPSQPPQLRAPAVDYLRALSLRRPFFNKALLALVLALGTAAVLLSLPSTGKATAFEPGRVRLAHADSSCASCHTPWRGPDPALCSDCHDQQREKGGIHQQSQAFTPPCTSCHPEHRGSDRVASVSDATCASCHADLQLKPGAEPLFARHVSSFVGDHPEFSVALPGRKRQLLAEAVAQRSDPTRLKFNHQRHLRPQLPTPSGRRVQLGCQDCHRLAAVPAAAAAGGQTAPRRAGTQQPAGGQEQPAGPLLSATAIVPVTYADSCTTSGCHPLTFDNRRPDQVAPHADPQRVREFLVSVYSDKRGANESVGDQYRRLVRGAQPREIDYGGQAQGAVVLAERYLYGTACKECHLVNTNARPVPTVEKTGIPQRWLRNARFSHLDHQASECSLCHAGAAASTVAADVLLPPIAVCRTCHGGSAQVVAGTAQPRAGTAPAAPTDCLSCHRYHPDSPNPAQTALPPPAARAAAMARAPSKPAARLAG